MVKASKVGVGGGWGGGEMKLFETVMKDEK